MKSSSKSIALLLWLELSLLAIFALIEVYPGYITSLGISLATFEVAIGALFIVLASVVFVLLLLPSPRKRKRRSRLLYQVLEKEDTILGEISALKQRLQVQEKNNPIST